MNVFDVAIIGGGPAGTSAAITLARAGHSVLLLEARPIPHDKLCGEFLSPECQSLLAQLGLTQIVRALHPTTIEHARIIADDGTQWIAPLPSEALGLSRYRLDFALIEEASRLGAVVREMRACIGVNGNLREGFEVVARNTRSEAQEKFRARVVISAHGKRSTMDRVLKRKFLGKHYPLFGMKRHYRGAPLDGVALHAFAGGYCGLAEVEDDAINLCFLADERVFSQAGPHPSPFPQRERELVPPSPRRREGAGTGGDARIDNFLHHMARANPTLGAWLRDAQPIGDQWLSVGALVFGARGTHCDDILLVGDAAALIAPLVGDGIAMALRGGQLCARAVTKFLGGTTSAAQLKAQYTRAFNAEFAPRVQLAGALQSLALRPQWLRPTLRLFQRAPALGRWAVHHTRGY